MITALDSSVILDVLTARSAFAEASETMLRQAATEGKLVISECALAEICPAFPSATAIEEFLADWEIEFVPSSRPSVLLAGRFFAHTWPAAGKAVGL